MNQKNQLNNNQETSKNTKKHSLILVIKVAYYLGLLSSIQQKPTNPAATGFINLKERKAKVNDQEIYLPADSVLPIGGTKAKSLAGRKKEINYLVLSKYQSSSNLLSEKTKHDKEIIAKDYPQAVPKEIKEKMKVYGVVESMKELKELVLGGKLS